MFIEFIEFLSNSKVVKPFQHAFIYDTCVSSLLGLDNLLCNYRF